MQKALLNIDYTNDFVADHGALTCGDPGQNLHDYILGLTREFFEAGELIAFCIDAHLVEDPYHPESKLFPAHNIMGTEGRILYGELEDFYQQIKDQEHVMYFDKTRYSAFTGTNLELKLRERGIKELHLVGVCTDICILHTAIDAYNKGFETIIHEQGVASFDDAGHYWALNHFKDCLGFKIIS